MANINYDDETVWNQTSLTTTRPGAGARKLIFAKAGKTLKIVTGNITGDSSYPTNGEDISDIWQNFSSVSQCLGLLVDTYLTTADTGVLARVDFPNKKLKLYTALGTELGNTVTWANTTVRFIAWGT